MGNCSPSPRRDRPDPTSSPPPPHRAASGGAASGGNTSATTVSPYALARSPSVSVSVDPDPDDESSVVRVYGSDGCPVAWRLRVALLYKAAAPLHFTPSEAAPLGRPMLRLSAADPELCGTADELLRHVDARFEGKPTVAPPPPPQRRPATRASLAAAAAEEVAEMVRLQHRSAERHLEGVAAKLAEMVKKGGKKAGKGRVVAAEGAEVRRLGKWYGDAMEVMLEHARMEERVLFPDIQRASFPGQ
jgi:hypothetical protein